MSRRRFIFDSQFLYRHIGKHCSICVNWTWTVFETSSPSLPVCDIKNCRPSLQVCIRARARVCVWTAGWDWCLQSRPPAQFVPRKAMVLIATPAVNRTQRNRDQTSAQNRAKETRIWMKRSLGMKTVCVCVFIMPEPF